MLASHGERDLLEPTELGPVADIERLEDMRRRCGGEADGQDDDGRVSLRLCAENADVEARGAGDVTGDRVWREGLGVVHEVGQAREVVEAEGLDAAAEGGMVDWSASAVEMAGSGCA